jgi:hypothetical protein
MAQGTHREQHVPSLTALYDGSYPPSPNPSANAPFVAISGAVNSQNIFLGNVFRWSQIQLAYAATGAAGVRALFQARMLDMYEFITNPVNSGAPYAALPAVPNRRDSRPNNRRRIDSYLQRCALRYLERLKQESS